LKEPGDPHIRVRLMSSSGLEVFDRTIQETNIWLGEIADDLGPDRQVAYRVLRAVLHALRDRLTVEQAAHLSAQLPMLIRGIYYESYQPAKTPNTARSRIEFRDAVRGELNNIPPGRSGGLLPLDIRLHAFAHYPGPVGKGVLVAAGACAPSLRLD